MLFDSTAIIFKSYIIRTKNPFYCRAAELAVIVSSIHTKELGVRANTRGFAGTDINHHYEIGKAAEFGEAT